jgi:hypothetical protein
LQHRSDAEIAHSFSGPDPPKSSRVPPASSRSKLARGVTEPVFPDTCPDSCSAPPHN